MSFYNIVQNQAKFSINNPLKVISQEIKVANANIIIPSSSEINGASSIISGSVMLNGYIIRNPGANNDTTDSATNILQALKTTLLAINPTFSGSFPNGTRFSFSIFNKTGSSYTLNPGTGVTFGASNGNIDNGNASIFTLIVTGQTLLGDASNKISIINLDY